MSLRKRKANESSILLNASEPPTKIRGEKTGKEGLSDFNLIDYLSEKEWLDALKPEFEKEYFKDINTFLKSAYKNKKTSIKPPYNLIFNAFNSTKLSQVDEFFEH
jgi:hypothetical protein